MGIIKEKLCVFSMAESIKCQNPGTKTRGTRKQHSQYQASTRTEPFSSGHAVLCTCRQTNSKQAQAFEIMKWKQNPYISQKTNKGDLGPILLRFSLNFLTYEIFTALFEKLKPCMPKLPGFQKKKVIPRGYDLYTWYKLW